MLLHRTSATKSHFKRGLASKRYIFLFPGQGSQRSGMAADLLKNDLAVRLFGIANDVAGIDVQKL
jgi:malonyl CoA-acyl carrier protein transacylase